MSCWRVKIASRWARSVAPKPCPHVVNGKRSRGKECPYMHGANAAVAVVISADLSHGARDGCIHHEQV